MKKTTALTLALLFSAVMLLGEAINAAPLAGDATRNLCCRDLPDCGGTACCNGPGTYFACTMVCKDGTAIICRDDVDGE